MKCDQSVISRCLTFAHEADWTSNANIVGYPNALDECCYVKKPALELLLHAQAHPAEPHFLILDEMNLSHVERYFADLLSAIESGEAIPLHSGAGDIDGVPNTLALSPNVFIIGTVNVDETTYMFSPKVLDRANVIEFSMDEREMTDFLQAPKRPDMHRLNGRGAAFGPAFVNAASQKDLDMPVAVKAHYEREMALFFKVLKEHRAEFGYRVANEAARFMHFYHLLGGYDDADESWFNAAMDAIIVQKLLPKLHGNRAEMEPLLRALAVACETSDRDPGKIQDAIRDAEKRRAEVTASAGAVFPLSHDKLARMWAKLKRDQFVSFAEA